MSLFGGSASRHKALYWASLASLYALYRIGADGSTGERWAPFVLAVLFAMVSVLPRESTSGLFWGGLCLTFAAVYDMARESCFTYPLGGGPGLRVYPAPLGLVAFACVGALSGTPRYPYGEQVETWVRRAAWLTLALFASCLLLGYVALISDYELPDAGRVTWLTATRLLEACLLLCSCIRLITPTTADPRELRAGAGALVAYEFFLRAA